MQLCLNVTMMPNSSRSSSTMFPNPKRSACDRCRSQKLRCPPRDHTSQSCSRCTRLGANCITSFHRPLGRISKSRPPGSPRRFSQPELRPMRIEPSEAISLFTARPSPLALPSQSIDLCDESLSVPTNTSQNTPAFFGPRSLGAFLSDDVRFSGGSQNEESEDGESLGFKESYKIGYLSMLNGRNNVESEPTVADTTEMFHQLSDDCISEQPSCVLQCDQRLSHLNVRLSTRLTENFLGLKAHNSNPISRSPSQGSTPSEGARLWSSKALGDILRDTAEFASIIKSYNSRRSSTGQEENSSVGERLDSPSIKPRLGTVVQLDLISAYLQIVATYDNLLQYLCSNFCTDDSPPSSPSLAQDSPAYWLNPVGLEWLQPLPGMEVAGFQVHQGTLQAKLLLETILHHLAIVERLLGLPRTWRATDKRESRGVGLFKDTKACLILDAISMNSFEQSGGDLRSHGELPTVISLRDGIKRLRAFID
ncbi:hypothetical protein F5B20DRAFT_513158 [Whalleya microplaca]|nr:hypothetical protein F5B20DRAFT_513158 [Whalleya microplaca]